MRRARPEHVLAHRFAPGHLAGDGGADWQGLAWRGQRSRDGRGAAVPGFTIAGKTGTAQKVDPKGGYERGKSVVSFSGYLPAEHPEFVGLVVLDDAQTATRE